MYYPRGQKSLMRGVVTEASESGKLVTGNGSSEENQTAKPGTAANKKSVVKKCIFESAIKNLLL